MVVRPVRFMLTSQTMGNGSRLVVADLFPAQAVVTLIGMSFGAEILIDFDFARLPRSYRRRWP